MSVNVLHLVSGEQVVTKLTELTDEGGTPFCFLLQMPMTLSLVPQESGESQINFFPWSPFSGSSEFRVGFDKVVTISEPTKQVFQTYVEINQPHYPILSPVEFKRFQESVQS